MARALHERKEYNGLEIVVERPDRQRVTALAYANPIIDASDQLAEGVSVLVDISEHKLAESLLSESHERLVRQVMERTVELTELSQHLFQVAEDERARLADELHDEMGSILTLLTLKLGDIGRALRGSDPLALGEYKEALQLLQDLVASQRRIVGSLRPVLLDTFGLPLALRQYVENCTGIAVKLDIPSGLLPLAAEAALAIFRIVQEALTNIVNSARASLVSVTVAVADRGVSVCIEDDGVGIGDEATRGTLHGTSGMRERLLRFGGELVVGPGAGRRGVRLCALMPMHEHGAALSA